MGRGPWYSDDENGIPFRMWQHNLESSLFSPKGQEMLLKLEEALLALPVKGLAGQEMASDGLVCALGALEAQRLVRSSGDSLETVIAWMQDAYDSTGSGLTILIGCDLGFSKLAAAQIAATNDDDMFGVLPENRFERVLAWVRDHILPMSLKEARAQFPYLVAFARVVLAYNSILRIQIEAAIEDRVGPTAVYRKGTGEWVYLDEFMGSSEHYDRHFRERVKHLGDQYKALYVAVGSES